MSPILKYSLARLGIFLAVAAIMLALPVDISPLLKLMIAVLVSMILAFFILRRLRDEVAVQATGGAKVPKTARGMAERS